MLPSKPGKLWLRCKIACPTFSKRLLSAFTFACHAPLRSAGQAFVRLHSCLLLISGRWVLFGWINIFAHLNKTTQPDNDPPEDLLHLGAIMFTSSERVAWRLEKRSPVFQVGWWKCSSILKANILKSCKKAVWDFAILMDLLFHCHLIEIGDGYVLRKIDENLIGNS